MAVARMHVRSWQTAYRGLLFDDYLDALQPEEWAQRYTFADPQATNPLTVLAVEGSEICGLATIGPAGDGDQQAVGELIALYVDPDRRGLGVGRALIQEARARLARQGFAERVFGCSPEMSGPSASTGSTVGPPTVQTPSQGRWLQRRGHLLSPFAAVSAAFAATTTSSHHAMCPCACCSTPSRCASVRGRGRGRRGCVREREQGCHRSRA